MASGDEEVLISVQGVSKKFCRSLKRSLWYGLQDIGSELMGGASRQGLRPDEFWALRDISFELRRGECLGLIGRNGAGKTTLLRMLNGLIKPNQGQIKLHGRLGSMIALGAGFDPLLTGKENVYVNASVLGLTKAEIDEKYEEIVDFAELHDFMDAPVSSYSSGMYVRLGFAVASMIKPDILIIDEVLAVGDTDFRLKSSKRMKSLLNSNCAVIVVSHNMTDIRNLATQAIWLDKGQVQKVGSPHEVISAYLGTGVWETSDIRWDSLEQAPGCEAVRLRRLAVLPPPGETCIQISSGFLFVCEFDCKETNLNLGFTLQVSTEEKVIVFHSGGMGKILAKTKLGVYRIKVKIPPYFLNAGKYRGTIIIGESQSIPLVVAEDIVGFSIGNTPIGSNYSIRPGVTSPKLDWEGAII
ncbi:MAG: ABC transporter ATP-binding protein [Snowella sp.]|nr:ABC transporter ATP-binding protein [Snowella sp.]